MERFRARRSLGQSFLSSKQVADDIVASLDPGQADTVLEVGPGKGVLTARLLARACRVIAVELDPRLVRHLAERFSGQPGLDLVEQDFLEYDLGRHRGLKVIGNLPYNISSQVLFRLLDSLPAWDRAVLTTQREFATRVLAAPGSKSYAALTVFFERLCTREKLFNIAARDFKPHPAVVSTAFRLERRDRPLFPVDDEGRFRRVVKAAFAQRRKTIANNLTAALGFSKDRCRAVLASCGVPERTRAEMLSPADFDRLYRAVRSAGWPDSAAAQA